jgi:tol-pal system protein YbgF
VAPVAAFLLWPAALAHGQGGPAVERAPLDAPAGAAEAGQRAAKGSEAPQAAATGSDQGLRQRVEQLEEQLVDLQVVVGTLESLARASGARGSPAASVAPGGGLGASDQARLEGIETQIRALTAQLEQLASEVHGLGGAQRRTDTEGSAPQGVPTGAGEALAPGTTRFGSTTVTSDSSDPIGGILAGDGGAAPANGPGRVAAAEPAAEAFGTNPKQIYERAYGYLLQKNYSAAQAGFSEFLKRYPNDPQAPDALYWLGEAHYVQRNYADAAEAFDLVTTSFGSSTKAPDAQLKRAMALAQIGKKQDACAAFRELGARYPGAPSYVKSKAESERQRTGCP